MTGVWKNYIAELSSEYPELLTANEKDVSAPIIASPIDKGSRDLLLPYTKSWLDYPALELEYLIRTINDHLSNCLELREKAQELETRAISEAMERSLQVKIFTLLTKQSDLAAENEAIVLGNCTDAKFTKSNEEEATIVGTPNQNYWKQLNDLIKKQLLEQDNHARLRLEQMKEPGSGLNYVARFLAIKDLFNIDLREAYLRAKAAAIGIKEVYDLDRPLPALTDIGYLDLLTKWAYETTYELEKKLFNWQETVIAFALNSQDKDLPKILSKADFDAALKNGSFTFNITEELFNRMNVKILNPRMRGIDVTAYLNGKEGVHKYWRVRVDLPEQEIIGDDGVKWRYNPQVYLPRVSYSSVQVPDLNYLSQRRTHNVSPIGEWTIKIEKQNFIDGVETSLNTEITNLILTLRVSYER